MKNIYRNIAVLLSLDFRSAILGGGSVWKSKNGMGTRSCRQQYNCQKWASKFS